MALGWLAPPAALDPQHRQRRPQETCALNLSWGLQRMEGGVDLRTQSIRSGLEDWSLDLAMLGIAMRPAMGLRISQAENGNFVFRTSQARSAGSQPPA